MALITCPECGERISSSADVCPHCGCKFIVCPECGNAYVFPADYCAECGYVFKHTSNHQEQNIKSSADMDKFKQRLDYNRALLKKANVVFVLIYVLSILLMLAAPVMIILLWSPQGNFDDLLRFKDTCNTITGLTVTGCVCLAVSSSLKREGTGFIQVIFGKWLRKNNYDMIPYIKKPDGDNEFKKYLNSKDFDNISSSAYISKIPQAGAILVGKCITFVILLCVSCIFVGQAVAVLWNYLFMLKNYENLDLINIKDALVHVIVFFGIIIIANISELIFNHVFQRKKESWFKDLGISKTQVIKDNKPIK